MTEDKIIDKIQKLLAKAERAGSQEEADAFSAKAQELMVKYTVDEMQLAQARGEKVKEDITSERIKAGGSYALQDVALWLAVAQANSCRVFYSGYSGKPVTSVTVIGYPSDIANVKLLVTSLLIQLARTCRRDCPTYLDGWEKFVWRRSYRDAFAYAIGKRLTTTREEVADGAGLLPAIRDRSQEVEDYMNEQNPNIEAARASRTQWDSHGASNGQAAADRVDVGAPRVNAAVRGAISQ